MDGAKTPIKSKNKAGDGTSEMSPARTPHGRLIFGNSATDSPLPSFVEVDTEDSPARSLSLTQELSSGSNVRSDIPRFHTSRFDDAQDVIEELDIDEDIDINEANASHTGYFGRRNINIGFDNDSGDDEHNPLQMGEFQIEMFPEETSDDGDDDDRHMDVDDYGIPRNNCNDVGVLDSDHDIHEDGDTDSDKNSEDSDGSDEGRDFDEDHTSDRGRNAAYDNDDDDDDDDDDDSNNDGDENEADQLSRIFGDRNALRRNLFGLDFGGISRIGSANQFRPLVAALKQYDDQTQQLAALQELTELLSISTEESFIGLNIGDLAQVLVNLLKGADGDYGDLTGFVPSNPDIMLLACRCLSNLLEALPFAGAILVRLGAPEVLCGKLLEIEYIDLAEQALSTLETLSREFPRPVCEAGGMSACLQFLDFFATNTQRTALACAANCAKGILSSDFAQARDAIQIVGRTITYSDQKIVESSCTALHHIISAFQLSSDNIEQLVSLDILKTIFERISSENALTNAPVTILLQILSTITYCSHERAAQLLDMDIIPILEKILISKCIGHATTGSGTDRDSNSESTSGTVNRSSVTSNEQRQQQQQQQQFNARESRSGTSSVTRMSDQAWEALHLLVVLLPRLPDTESTLKRTQELVNAESTLTDSQDNSDQSNDYKEEEEEEEEEDNDATKQFQRVEAIVKRPKVISQLQGTLVSTMMDIFLSTMNTAARYRTLLIIVKVTVYLDTDHLRDSLQDIGVSTFVANILSSCELPLITGLSLLLIRMLLLKLPGVYASRFVREGVTAELSGLINQTKLALQKNSENSLANVSDHGLPASADADADTYMAETSERALLSDLAYGFKILNIHVPNSSRTSTSGVFGRYTLTPRGPNSLIHGKALHLLQWIKQQASSLKNELDETGSNATSGSTAGCDVLHRVKHVVQQLGSDNSPNTNMSAMKELAACFLSAESVTCYEMMQSGLIDALLNVIGSSLAENSRDSRLKSFVPSLVAALLSSKESEMSGESLISSQSALTILLSKLHEALNLAEDVRISEAYQTPSDELRTPATMLTKQIRFKVVPASKELIDEICSDVDDKDLAKEMATVMDRVRSSFQPILVSIHAIATFSVLGAYLRPRVALSISKRRRSHRHRNNDETDTGSEEEDASGFVPPQQAYIGNQQDLENSGTSGTGRSTRHRGVELRRQHFRMLQMIAQSSGIDLRAAGLLDSLPSNENDEEITDDSDDDAMHNNSTGEGSRGSSSSHNNNDSTEEGNGSKDSQDDAISIGSSQQMTTTNIPSSSLKLDEWSIAFNLKSRSEDDAYIPVSSDDNIFRTISSTYQQSKAPMEVNPWMHTFELQFYIDFKKSEHDKKDTESSTTISEISSTSMDVDADSGANTRQSLGSSSVNTYICSHETTVAMFGKQAASIMELIKALHAALPEAKSIHHMQVSSQMKGAKTDACQPCANSLSTDAFVNRKISAKLSRQLDDPLFVVCDAIPQWCHQLAHSFSFFVPFDTRMSYLYSTSFGYSRNINRWQAIAQRELRESGRSSSDIQIPLGRIQRQKVRIARHRMLESAVKVMELYGSSKTILEIEYFDEVGTGLGPTLEFYATVSEKLQERSLGLWRDDRTEKAYQSGHVQAPRGLFPSVINVAKISARTPAPNNANPEPVDATLMPGSLSPAERAVQLFKFIGHFIAKGLIDRRILDIPLHREFWAAVLRHSNPEAAGAFNTWSWSQIKLVDPDLARSLKYLQGFVDKKEAIYACKDLTLEQKLHKVEGIIDEPTKASIDDLVLDFTLPGYPDIELRDGGSAIPVTISNVHTYIDLVAKWTLDIGIKSQVAAFCDGFNKVFPVRDLSIFTPEELSGLVGPILDNEDWSMATLLNCVKADHGFSITSPAVQMFLSFMESLDSKGRRRFLQFVTGSPRLPYGGFNALHPPLTLVHKPCEPPLTPDDYLPSVMTCANYIKLPNYSSAKILEKRWNHASTEGQQSFHLS